eukprot:14454880-Alexandrium_andersonii.AAC.1
MDAMEVAFVAWGLEFSAADWFVCTPFHHWAGARPYRELSKSGYKDVAGLLAHSLCAINAVQTSKDVAESSSESA